MKHRVIKHPNKYAKYKFAEGDAPAWLWLGLRGVPSGGVPRAPHSSGASDPVPLDEEEITLLFGKVMQP